ncbi:MAG: hypothetical protein ABFR63_07640 [Thermodesulfobacteriota bacterium]
MIIFTSQKKTSLALAAPGFLFFALLCQGQTAHALPADPQQENADILEQKSEKPPFEYLIEGRPDPFVPFIQKKASAAKKDEVLPIEEQLTGMQLFEPGQLNLVAVMMAEEGEIAMAEDTTGKGYILHEGMKIGRRGVITSIGANKVIIEETAFTRAGKKLTNNIVMLLKKEGEE